MLGNLFGEQRAVSFQTVWGAGEPFGLQSESGVNVTTKKSFEIVAFFSAVSLISDTISTLPCGAYLRIGPTRRPLNPRPVWLDQPDVDLSTRAAFFQQVFSALLVHGNSYTRVFRDAQGQVVNLVNLDPEKVEVERSKIGRKVYKVYGEGRILTNDEVIHIVDLIMPGELTGLSRVETLKQSLGLNIALSDYAARFFGTGASASGVIEFPGNLTSEQAKQLADGFDARHRNGTRRAHKTGVLSGGAKFVATQLDPETSQALESRKFAVEEGDQYRVPLANIALADTEVITLEKRVKMVQQLVLSGFTPSEALAAVGLGKIAHTGLPSTQLQPVAQIDPADPTAVYGAE
jgi:HK97 family phage portal protein